jgi:tRNA threonylcarbamoyladenosine biosynthesis protein TsaE
VTVLSVGECRLRWESASPEETERVGALLGARLAPGDVIALSGELGSGKTVFVRGIASGLGCSAADVHSPTFTLVNEYPMRGMPGRPGPALAHIDLYRIGSAADVPGIGWDEYMRPRYVVAVEWAERADRWLPRDRIGVSLAVEDGGRRGLVLDATGPRSSRILREWAAAVGAGVELA